MKHHLPQLEHFIKKDYVLLHRARLSDDETMDLRPDQGPLFIKAGSDYYWMNPSAPHPFRKGNFAPISMQSVQADDTLTDVTAAFTCCPMAIVEQNGESIGYITASDILEAAVQSHRYLDAYFRTTLEALNPDVAITLINEESKVAVWTSGAEHIFSIPKQEIIGKPATDFFPADRLQSLKTLETGDAVHKKQHQPRQDLFVLINASPIELDGKIIGAVAAESDITTQIRLNQELLHMTSKVHRLQKEMAKLSPSSDPFHPIKGTSSAIKNSIHTIKKISATKATILIQGESGTGKELFAKAIHDSRESASAPFIAINCGAIPAALFESELFGYERGAFSGADPRGKKGKFELANGGTLFLDEIGEMPLDMQVKLLRVLQERNYFAVGGTQLKSADCRIIAATNRNLKAMINEGKFREDLYYRLNVVSVEVPALRERKEDIYDLTQTFLHEFSLTYGRHIQSFAPGIFEDLLRYDWPGNIRELRNTIERLVIFSTDGEIKREHLPAPIYTGNNISSTSASKPDATIAAEESSLSFQEKLDEYERHLLLQALEAVNGNKLAMAKKLGISRATLYNKLKRLNL